MNTDMGLRSVHMGVPEEVGSGYGHFEVLGGGSEGVYVVRFANNLRNIPRCEKR